MSVDARSSSTRCPRVLMYSKWGCGHCMWARRLLEAKGVEVEHVNVTFRPSAFREMVQRSGGRTSAPQIFIGDYHVGGYRELVELDQRGKLDELLDWAAAPAAPGRDGSEDTA